MLILVLLLVPTVTTEIPCGGALGAEEEERKEKGFLAQNSLIKIATIAASTLSCESTPRYLSGHAG